MGATASQAFVRATSGLSCGPPHRPSMPAGGAGCEVANRLITDPRRPADVREGKSAVIDQAPDCPHAHAQHPGCLGDGAQQRDNTGSARAHGERVDERLLHGAIPAAGAYESRTSRLRAPRPHRSERRVRSIRCVRHGEVRRVRAYRRGSFASSESTDAVCSTRTVVQPRTLHSDLSANCYMGAAGGGCRADTRRPQRERAIRGIRCVRYCRHRDDASIGPPGSPWGCWADRPPSRDVAAD